MYTGCILIIVEWNYDFKKKFFIGLLNYTENIFFFSKISFQKSNKNKILIRMDDIKGATFRQVNIY